MMFSRRWLPILLIITGFLFITATSAMRESLTFDEPVHIQEGIAAWTKRSFAVDVVNPPLIRELAVAPLLIGLGPENGLPHMAAFPARGVIILLGVVLIVSVYWITSVFVDETTGLIAAFLLAFEPNILAHSHLVTLDLGYTTFVFVCYAWFVYMMHMRRFRTFHFIILGLAAGAALASKVTSLLLLPAWLTGSALVLYGKETVRIAMRHAGKLGVSVAISIIVVWGSYFFTTGTIVAPGGTETRVSRQLYQRASQEGNGVLLFLLDAAQSWQLPLGTYMAMVKNSVIYGRQQGENIFFLGAYHDGKDWFYDSATLMMKTPMVLQLFFMLGIAAAVLKKRRTFVAVLGLPIVIVLIVSYLAGVQPAVRYLLPVYPFMAGIAAVGSRRLAALSRRLWLVAIVWYLLGTIVQYPHYLTYTNLLVPASDRYLLFSDSNLDWGQGLVTLQTYVRTYDPVRLRLSYFGRDDGAAYGFSSDMKWGSYKFDEICAFHHIDRQGATGEPITIISASNWYACGYYKEPAYEHADTVVSDMFLVFRHEPQWDRR